MKPFNNNQHPDYDDDHQIPDIEDALLIVLVMMMMMSLMVMTMIALVVVMVLLVLVNNKKTCFSLLSCFDFGSFVFFCNI